MQPLPVPPLAQTLDRTLETLAPLLDEERFAATSAAVAEFADGDGPACQAELEGFAERAAAEGGNWMADAWLDSYLGVRTPLPLTTSVGFQIALPSASPDPLERAADALHRLAAVHLAYLRGDLEPEVDRRGETIDPGQRRALAGGLRRPGPGRDTLDPPDLDPKGREIVVLHRGRAFAVTISDDAGAPLPVPTLRESLSAVALAPDAPPEVPFAAWSVLGAQDAAAYEREVLGDPAGAAVHARLARALFVAALVDEPLDVAEFLHRLAFGVGDAWAGKPISYRIGLADGRFGAHVEHSLMDGATFADAVARAQRVGPDTTDGVAATPEPLRWSLPPVLEERLRADLDAYRERAARLALDVVRVPAPASRLGRRISRDAMSQFLFAYAQLAATGRVANTYESVDMRHYQAGRTETVRPVTVESVALVHALRVGTATPDQLDAALAAHRERIKRAKAGQAIDRPLLGLLLAAERLGLRPAVFDDSGLEVLATDALSTTSLGSDAAIVRLAFAPTSVGGLGIDYTPLADEDEYVIAHDASVDVGAFVDGLREGAERLWALALARTQ